MKTLLKLLVLSITLLGSVLLAIKINTPEFVQMSSKSCPFEHKIDQTPVMVVRVVDNSELPKDFIKRCLLNQMTEKNGIVFVNRENEPQILHELAHQSEIPARDNSIQPIGEILVPSHLYVINQKESWVEVSLSEIKSGIYVLKEEFQFSPLFEQLKKNSKLIFKSVVIAILWFSFVVILNLILSPVYRWMDHKNAIKVLTKKFQEAQYLISQNNIYAAGNLLVECARSPTDCPSRNSAKTVLNKLSTMIKD